MRIFVDAMGGDFAPQAPVEGSIEALRRYENIEIVLAGDLKQVEPLLKDCDDVRGRITLVDAPEVITNHESPVMGVRSKKNSATVIGMLQLKEKLADGFVSAGSTGAVLAGGMFRLGRIHGVERPALAPLLPNGKGHFLLIDCGANVDCKPEYLQQFGVMGAAYMKGVMGIEEPRVGLINIGAESEKGNALVKETFPLMEKAPYNFIGNVEARDITADQADVLVCDGFTGNVVMKFMEGVAGTLMGIIKKEMMADLRGKIAGLIAKPAFRRVKKMMDYTEVGGAPLLGVQGNVVKAHGSSNAHAFACAIGQVIRMADGHVVEVIEQGVAATQEECISPAKPGISIDSFRNYKEETTMIFEAVKSMIAKQLKVDEATITADSRLIEDLKADSANVMVMIMDLEDKYGIMVEDDQIMKLKTVGDVVSYIEAHQ